MSEQQMSSIPPIMMDDLRQARGKSVTVFSISIIIGSLVAFMVGASGGSVGLGFLLGFLIPFIGISYLLVVEYKKKEEIMATDFILPPSEKNSHVISAYWSGEIDSTIKDSVEKNMHVFAVGKATESLSSLTKSLSLLREQERKGHHYLPDFSSFITKKEKEWDQERFRYLEEWKRLSDQRSAQESMSKLIEEMKRSERNTR